MRCTTLAQLAVLLIPAVAAAHFKLDTPTNWTNQAGNGDPQKTEPCGNEGAADNGSITEYKAGSTITISINETIAHSGHYRVSLAANQAALPPDPDGDVKPDAASACGSLAINPNPTLPLLADGLLATKQTNRTGPQTMQVTLPANMTCEKCVLQVVQFMSNHGAPCFYHHCANIKISANGPSTPPDAGVPPTGGPDAGPGGNPNTGTTGGCSVGGGDVTGAALLALAIGLVLSRRRRS